MIISKKSIEKILMTLIVFSLYKFFFLLDYNTSSFANGLYGLSSKTIIYISLIYIIVICIFRKKFPKFKTVIPILIFECAVIILGFFTGKDNFFTYIYSYSAFLILYICFVQFCRDAESEMTLVSLVEIGSIITCSVVLFQAFVLMNGGPKFLHIYFWDSGYWYMYRNDSVRVVENDLLYMISFCLSLGVLQSKCKGVKRLIAVANCLIVLTYEIVVSQTRMYMLTMLVIVFIPFVLDNKLSARKLIIRLITLGIVFAATMFSWDQIVQKIGFSMSEASITMRLRGYIYYLVMGIKSFPLGIGFNNVSTVYYTADIGIIGLFAKYGFVSLCCYIYFIYVMIKRMMIIDNSNLFEKKSSINIITLIIILSTVLLMFDVEQIKSFSLVIALSETFFINGKLQRE